MSAAKFPAMAERLQDSAAAKVRAANVRTAAILFAIAGVFFLGFIASRFMGDYWGACVPLAVSALQDHVPANAEVVVRAPYDAAMAQYRRLRQGRFSARPEFGPYRLVRAPSGPDATVSGDHVGPV